MAFHLLCVLCVQLIRDNQLELECDPYIGEERRSELEREVYGCENLIRTYKHRIVQLDAELAKIGKPRVKFLFRVYRKDPWDLGRACAIRVMCTTFVYSHINAHIMQNNEF